MEVSDQNRSEFNYCSRSIHKAIYMGQLILCPFTVYLRATCSFPPAGLRKHSLNGIGFLYCVI